jgi:hypothetical protein
VSVVPEPRARSDGRCLVCPKQRRVEGLRPLYEAAMRDDPFCSSTCCRAWYGVSLPSTERKPRGYVSNVTGAG